MVGNLCYLIKCSAIDTEPCHFGAVAVGRHRPAFVGQSISHAERKWTMSQQVARQRADQEETKTVFGHAMLSLTRQFGLQYFVVAKFPEADRTGLNENMIVTNWPRELLARYEHTDMFRRSRIINGLKNSILPVCSETLLFARAKADGLGAELLGLFYDIGFSNTLGLSIHDAARHQYLIMFSGERKIVDDEEIGLLILDAMRALDHFGKAEFPTVGLTDREVTCLRWSAAGKSSEEIAIILDISPHTVNSHLKSAMRRLETVNRIQAVAKASRLRLI